MSQTSELTVKISADGAETAEAMLNRIADAAERAKKAINELNGSLHGGISIQIVGDVARVSIAPVEG